MKISYFPEQTALQSEPVWRAFLKGCQLLGMTLAENSYDADCAVIWSVLWSGRLRHNKQVYDYYRSRNKPVFIIEVGSLDRGRLWKISVNNITNQGVYAHTSNIDPNRSKKLNLALEPIKTFRAGHILVLGQHTASLQWSLSDNSTTWVEKTITEIKQYSDRPIVVRQHPRNPIIPKAYPNVTYSRPTRLSGTYDKFDIDYNCHCVVAHNSGPTIQSIISGTPVVCHSSSLAAVMAVPIHQIESCTIPDRTEWFNQIVHTEWLIEEIEQGIPQKRLLTALDI